MTIIEAIKEVLKDEPGGLSSGDIYQRIIDKNLYKFGAKNPVGVVNGELDDIVLALNFPLLTLLNILQLQGKMVKNLNLLSAQTINLRKMKIKLLI